MYIFLFNIFSLKYFTTPSNIVKVFIIKTFKLPFGSFIKSEIIFIHKFHY